MCLNFFSSSVHLNSYINSKITYKQLKAIRITISLIVLAVKIESFKKSLFYQAISLLYQVISLVYQTISLFYQAIKSYLIQENGPLKGL
jgi:hypothetical protein